MTDDQPLWMTHVLTPTQEAVESLLRRAEAMFTDPMKWSRHHHAATRERRPCAARDPMNPAVAWSIHGALWHLADKIAHAELAAACIRDVLGLGWDGDLLAWQEQPTTNLEGVRKALRFARRRVPDVVKGDRVWKLHASYAEEIL